MSPLNVGDTYTTLISGACPRLESISIHVGISDYFADTKDPKSIAKFKKEMDQLRVS